MWDVHASDSQRPDWRTLGEQAGLDERELRAAGHRRRYARGTTIFHEGDPAGAMHLLDVGRVAVRLTTLLGDVSIIDVLRPGDTFGEQVLVHGPGTRTATVTALERVETLALDPASFAGLDQLAVSRFLLMVLGTRLRETSRQLLDARYLPADQRLARCVRRLGELFDRADIPLTQADVASMTGVTRSTANRLLQQLANDGVIEVSRGRVRIVEPAALDRAAGR